MEVSELLLIKGSEHKLKRKRKASQTWLFRFSLRPCSVSRPGDHIVNTNFSLHSYFYFHSLLFSSHVSFPSGTISPHVTSGTYDFE
jgi:hypothetical protein